MADGRNCSLVVEWAAKHKYFSIVDAVKQSNPRWTPSADHVKAWLHYGTFMYMLEQKDFVGASEQFTQIVPVDWDMTTTSPYAEHLLSMRTQAVLHYLDFDNRDQEKAAELCKTLFNARKGGREKSVRAELLSFAEADSVPTAAYNAFRKKNKGDRLIAEIEGYLAEMVESLPAPYLDRVQQDIDQNLYVGQDMNLPGTEQKIVPRASDELDFLLGPAPTGSKYPVPKPAAPKAAAKREREDADEEADGARRKKRKVQHNEMEEEEEEEEEEEQQEQQQPQRKRGAARAKRAEAEAEAVEQIASPRTRLTIRGLKQSSAALKAHGVDPLAEAIAAAPRRRTGVVEYNEADFDVSVDTSRIGLPKTHIAKPAPLSPPSEAETPRKSKSKGRKDPTNRTRHPWTQTETASLLAGVKRYGEGAWAEILADPDFSFQSFRSSITLKDRFRNIKSWESQGKPVTFAPDSEAVEELAPLRLTR